MKLELTQVSGLKRPVTGGNYGEGLHSPYRSMKNTLQYIYSITVFCGVLVTAYLMMNRETSSRIPLRTFQTPVYRTETMVVDPALNQLFEVEDALSNLPKAAKKAEMKRIPAKTSKEK